MTASSSYYSITVQTLTAINRTVMARSRYNSLPLASQDVGVERKLSGAGGHGASIGTYQVLPTKERTIEFTNGGSTTREELRFRRSI